MKKISFFCYACLCPSLLYSMDPFKRDDENKRQQRPISPLFQLAAERIIDSHLLPPPFFTHTEEQERLSQQINTDNTLCLLRKHDEQQRLIQFGSDWLQSIAHASIPHFDVGRMPAVFAFAQPNKVMAVQVTPALERQEINLWRTDLGIHHSRQLLTFGGRTNRSLISADPLLQDYFIISKKNLRIYSLESGQKLLNIKHPHDDPICHAQWSPRGDTLLAFTEKGFCYLYKTSYNQPTCGFPDQHHHFNTHGTFLCTCAGRSISLIDTQSGNDVKIIPMPDDYPDHSPINCACASNDGTIVVSTTDHTLSITHPSQNVSVHIPHRMHNPTHVCMSPCSKWVAAYSNGTNNISIVDRSKLATGDYLRTIEHTENVLSLYINEHDTIVVIGPSRISLLDACTLTHLTDIDLPAHTYAFSQNQEYLASLTGTIMHIETVAQTKKVVMRLPIHNLRRLCVLMNKIDQHYALTRQEQLFLAEPFDPKLRRLIQRHYMRHARHQLTE